MVRATALYRPSIWFTDVRRLVRARDVHGRNPRFAALPLPIATRGAGPGGGADGSAAPRVAGGDTPRRPGGLGAVRRGRDDPRADHPGAGDQRLARAVRSARVRRARAVA